MAMVRRWELRDPLDALCVEIVVNRLQIVAVLTLPHWQ
jgi:hypothetical protein